MQWISLHFSLLLPCPQQFACPFLTHPGQVPLYRALNRAPWRRDLSSQFLLRRSVFSRGYSVVGEKGFRAQMFGFEFCYHLSLAMWPWAIQSPLSELLSRFTYFLKSPSPSPTQTAARSRRKTTGMLPAKSQHCAGEGGPPPPGGLARCSFGLLCRPLSSRVSPWPSMPALSLRPRSSPAGRLRQRLWLGIDASRRLRPPLPCWRLTPGTTLHPEVTLRRRHVERLGARPTSSQDPLTV